MAIPTITTDRLTLRPLTTADVRPLHRIMSDAEVMRYFPSATPPSLDKVARLIDTQSDHWAEHGYGWWAVERRDRRGLIGWCGLQYLSETDETEVAYLLARTEWGQGFATEGARAALAYGFHRLRMECIVAIVHIDNMASQRVVEKAGLTLTHQATYWGMACHHYAVERDAFESRAGRRTTDSEPI
jgi:RimJ/RimL family protein N-acetyltransferase